jgi:hypothetical protein
MPCHDARLEYLAHSAEFHLKFPFPNEKHLRCEKSETLPLGIRRGADMLQ